METNHTEAQPKVVQSRKNAKAAKRKHRMTWRDRKLAKLTALHGTVKAKEMMEGMSKHGAAKVHKHGWKVARKAARKTASVSRRINIKSAQAAKTRRDKPSGRVR